MEDGEGSDMLSLEEVRIEETGGNAVMPHGMRISYAPDPMLYVVGNCRSETGRANLQRTLMEKLSEIVATAMKNRPKPIQNDDETIYLREQLASQQAQIDRMMQDKAVQAGAEDRKGPGKRRGRPPKQAAA